VTGGTTVNASASASDETERPGPGDGAEPAPLRSAMADGRGARPAAPQGPGARSLVRHQRSGLTSTVRAIVDALWSVEPGFDEAVVADILRGHDAGIAKRIEAARESGDLVGCMAALEVLRAELAAGTFHPEKGA
jgi:hypothetical protein